MLKHIYVLGSNSFSAAHFINHVLKQDFIVTGVSRSAEYNSVFLPYLDEDGKRPKNFNFLQYDLNRDLENIIKSIQQDKPSYIVNFAAQGMVAESWQNPVQWFETNTIAPLKLYDALKNLDSLEKFVQISTPEVYGSTSGIIKENTHYEPSTPYAVSKASADMNLMSFYKAYNFPVVFTRAANVYGCCQQLYRIIPRTILYFMSGKTLELHGGGSSIRSFIHIKDVANATSKIMTLANPSEIYHISTQEHISIKELVYQIAKQMDIVAEDYIKVTGERLGKDSAYTLDCTALKEKLNWQDIISLEQGIDEMIKWTHDNFELLSTLPQNYQHKA